MTAPPPFPQTTLGLDQAATHIAVAPGGEIILRGSYASVRDGSIIDAVTTTWPVGTPEGSDRGGLYDLEAGGFRLVSHDPVTHEVHAVAIGGQQSACTAGGVASPCLPLRLLPQARSRHMTVSDWSSSLKGGILFEVPIPPQPARKPDGAQWLAGAGLLVVVAVEGVVLSMLRKRHARAPRV